MNGARRNGCGVEGKSVRYLILADDLTGALDTGLQLRRLGVPTKVLVGGENITGLPLEEGTPALVINTDSRHIGPEAAYRIVRDICREAKNHQVSLIYKKTDSVLRGNIGAELRAIVDAGYDTIYFAPAYPKLQRTTVGGRQLIQQVPIDHSSFGKDILNPIRTSFVPELLAESGLSVTVVPQEMELDALQKQRGVLLFDAETDERLGQIADWIATQKGRFTLAGCAGFAEHLEPVLRYGPRAEEPESKTYSGILVISGSLNLLSFSQIQTAAEAGFGVISMESFDGFLDQDNFEVTGKIVQEILDAYAKNPRLIIKTTDKGADSGDLAENLKAGQRVANHFGILASKLLKNGFDGLLVVSGGDTLGSIVRHVGGHSIEPVREIEPGIVLANLSIGGERQLVTKSGGIGSAEIYCRIWDMFIHKKPTVNCAGSLLLHGRRK